MVSSFLDPERTSSQNEVPLTVGVGTEDLLVYAVSVAAVTQPKNRCFLTR